MERRYQIWMGLDLIGHVYGNDVTIEDAVEYAIDMRGEDIDPDAVDMCKISATYYQDIERASAKDSLELGM